MIGVDEVGRGCLAGPLLVVAARQTGTLPDGLRDSKLLSRKQRETIYQLLVTSLQFGEGWVKPAEIDKRGISGAMRLGVARALRQLSADSEEEIVMDGPVNYLPRSYKQVKCIIGADSLVPLVSAASIYAKVKRDKFMTALAVKHPQYGFDSHVGYGTPSHLKALREFGALTNIHRQMFAPMKSIGQEAV